jgi:putative peptide zinc metalloprotease protein
MRTRRRTRRSRRATSTTSEGRAPARPSPFSNRETTLATTDDQETQVLQPQSGADAGARAGTDGNVPRLADGIELIGQMEGSGFKDPPYIARRSDGQVVQMPDLLYFIAEAIDGQRGYAEIAATVTERAKLEVAPDQIETLVDNQLRPLGILAQADGSTPELQKLDPMLALKFRFGVVPESATNRIATLLRPLFFPPVVLAMLAGLVVADWYVFLHHGVAQSVRSALYNPVFILLVLGLVVLSAAWHEAGHATACRYGGARPGKMGAGLYLVWPAFYTDVTDAYRLGKAGRLRTDLGGVYFNVIFILATVGAYLLTGFEPLLLLIPLQHMEIFHQFLPFLRLDGYYIVSDMTGVPDMFSRIKPTLKSMVPGQETADEVEELKPWARVAVTVYVLTVVPLLLGFLVLTLINVPRIFATTWDSAVVQYHAIGDGGILGALYHGFEMMILLLPAAGIALTFWQLGKRIFVGLWDFTDGRPAGRVLVGAVATASVGFAAFALLPKGEYKPIQPGERGTLVGAIEQVKAVPTGRPALTEERQRQLGGAPTKRSQVPDSTSGTVSTPSPAQTTQTQTTQTAPTPAATTTTTARETTTTVTTTTPVTTTTHVTTTTPAGSTTTAPVATTTTATTTTQVETTTPVTTTTATTP